MGARIKNDDVDTLERYLERRGLSFSQWVNEKIGEIGKIDSEASEGASEGILDIMGLDAEEYEDLGNIIKLSGGDMRTFFRDLYDKLDDYRIELEGGRIKLFNKE